VKAPFVASKCGHLVRPVLETGELVSLDGDCARCGLCEGVLDTAMLLALEHISALSDAWGKHACECGHPEMRHLPDGTFHRPSCGSEVLPLL
jgi:hypothetical protein